MRKRLALSGILILVQISGQLNALQFKGVTHGGMIFSGQLNRVQNGFIEFTSTSGSQPQQMGIPFSQVKSIQLPNDALDPELLIKLEPFLTLLPLFDVHAHGTLITHLESLAKEAEWAPLYRWTGYLQHIPAIDIRTTRIATLRAWALMEMGFSKQAGELLTSLESSMDPLDASALYCLLRAQVAIEENLPEEALYWASLPSLRIPAYAGNLSPDLETIRNDLSNSNPS
jgi:hypothetical protein